MGHRVLPVARGARPRGRRAERRLRPDRRDDRPHRRRRDGPQDVLRRLRAAGRTTPTRRGWWGDDPPFHHPVFVLTHHEREPLELDGGTTFHFVTGGIEEAIARAKEAAGEKDVQIHGGGEAVQQALAAGAARRAQHPHRPRAARQRLPAARRQHRAPGAHAGGRVAIGRHPHPLPGTTFIGEFRRRDRRQHADRPRIGARLRGADARHVPGRARPDDRFDGAADDRRRARRAQPPLVGGHVLPAREHRLHPALRQARRHARAQARLPVRGHRLPDRLRALGPVAVDGRADRLPRDPGPRRGRLDGRRAGDHRRRRPAA